MLLNRVWNYYEFTRAERKAANVTAGILLFFGTLGVVSFAYPEHAGMIWITLLHVIMGIVLLGMACMLVYGIWTILVAIFE